MFGGFVCDYFDMVGVEVVVGVDLEFGGREGSCDWGSVGFVGKLG